MQTSVKLKWELFDHNPNNKNIIDPNLRNVLLQILIISYKNLGEGYIICPTPPPTGSACSLDSTDFFINFKVQVFMTIDLQFPWLSNFLSTTYKSIIPSLIESMNEICRKIRLDQLTIYVIHYHKN